MPITFNSRAPVDETQRYSAAQIASITIDNRTSRIFVEVEYGNIKEGAFVRNPNVSGQTHVIDPNSVAKLSIQQPPLPNAGMYDNIKQLVWDWLVGTGLEQGTIV